VCTGSGGCSSQRSLVGPDQWLALDELRMPTDGTNASTSAIDGSAAPRWLTGLGVIGLVVPVVAYFWYIHHFGANVIVADEWVDIKVVGSSYSHKLTPGVLWTQWNENRMFFPRLIDLLLAYTTHLNVLDEEYLSGVMQVVATGLVITTHKRRSPSTPLVLYVPVAIVLLSFVQYGNALWGFQMAWYLIMLTLATCLFLLDRLTLTWPLLVVAIGVAIVGSFSSLQGLLIWPAGLVVICHRRRPIGMAAAWVVLALVTSSAYFYGLDSKQAAPFGTYAFHHPGASVKFFFVAIGDVVGAVVSTHNDTAVLLFGIFSFVLASVVVVVVAYGLRRDEADRSAIGLALICFGLLFALTLTVGRGYTGESGIVSRYTTFDVLVIVGSYLALLDRWGYQGWMRRSESDGSKIAPTEFRTSSFRRFLVMSERSRAGRTRRITFSLLLAGTIGAVCAQAGFGTVNGLAGARTTRHSEVVAADVLANIHQAPNYLVQYGLWSPINPRPVLLYYPWVVPFVRQMAVIVSTHHLSLDSTGEAAYYGRVGLFPDLPRK
jgi:hypothetical protein